MARFDRSTPDAGAFALESNLSEIHQCKDKLERALIRTGRKRQRNKRPRLDFISQVKFDAFKRTLRDIKHNFSSTINALFYLLHNTSTYQDLADDLMHMVHKVVTEYVIDDRCYNLAMECMIMPIIATIMEETELNRDSRHRQERRVLFIRHLLEFRLRKDEHEHHTSDDSTVEIESVSQQDYEPTQNENPDEDQSKWTASSTVDDFTPVAITILDILFDALSRHSQTISQSDENLEARVYHIMNICYIIDILRDTFTNVRGKVSSSPNCDTASLMPRLARELPRFEEGLRTNLELFELDNPMSLFRRDLRILLFQIKLMFKR